jgi:hypothetical protein
MLITYNATRHKGVVRLNVLDDMVSINTFNGLNGLVSSSAGGEKEAMFVDLLLII